jgi:threonine aldolase
VIDLYSDTMTRPTPDMRRFMCEAEVGDEQKGEDPTVNLLQETVAELLGKEAAVYLPSGTMCNEIAIKVHTRPGDEVLADRTSHLIHYEGGGPGLLSGVLVSPLDGERGVFKAAQVRAAMHPHWRYSPPTRMVSMENTSNLGGGRVWPLAAVEEVGAVAQELGLARHMDGARLMNAVVASGTPARAYAAAVDSVWIDFSKGLGAPVGACLAGSRAFIQEAWRYKQALGGAMRQAGIIAAGCLYALRHHVDRLAEDHDNARAFARGIAGLPGVALDPDHVDTNIVIFDVTTPGLTGQGLADRLLEDGQVRLSVMGERRLRAVTHLDVSRRQVDAAVQAMARALQGTR